MKTRCFFVRLPYSGQWVVLCESVPYSGQGVVLCGTVPYS